MFKITKNTDIISLLEQGYYIVCSDADNFDEGDCCDEYWHLEDAIGSPSGKSLYCYSFIYDPDCGGYTDKWYQDYEEWQMTPGCSIHDAKFACTIDELQQFI